MCGIDEMTRRGHLGKRRGVDSAEGPRQQLKKKQRLAYTCQCACGSKGLHSSEM